MNTVNVTDRFQSMLTEVFGKNASNRFPYTYAYDWWRLKIDPEMSRSQVALLGFLDEEIVALASLYVMQQWAVEAIVWFGPGHELYDVVHESERIVHRLQQQHVRDLGCRFCDI